MSNKLVQVGIPVFNFTNDFLKLINNLLQQTHQRLIIKICADKPRPVEFLFPDDPRIVFEENLRNIGVYNNTIKVLTPISETVDFTCLISDDDYVETNYLEKLLWFHGANIIDVVVPIFQITKAYPNKNFVSIRVPDYFGIDDIKSAATSRAKMNHIQFGMWKISERFVDKLWNFPEFPNKPTFRYSSADRLLVLGLCHENIRTKTCTSAVYYKYYDRPRIYRWLEAPKILNFSLNILHIINKVQPLGTHFCLKWSIKKIYEIISYKIYHIINDKNS